MTLEQGKGNCTLDTYVGYLLGEPVRTTCTGLSEILPNVSHDSVNRFLLSKNYSSIDLFQLVKVRICLQGGVLSVDDSIIDKPYSDLKKNELLGYHWSGKHHKTVKGICLITLYYTDPYGVCVPVSYRVYDPNEDKTKNDYFREMWEEVWGLGLRPAYGTGDSWYSSIENLKFIRKHGIGLCFGVEKNRLVSIVKGSFIHIEDIENWDENGLVVYLKDFGMVRVFRQMFKNMPRYYVMAMPKIEMLDDIGLNDFKMVHDRHWNIERFHRAAKQLCNLEKFQVRASQAIMNHIFCALMTFVTLEFLRVSQTIENWYQLQRNSLNSMLRNFLKDLPSPIQIIASGSSA